MPDWTYQTVFRPALFALGPRRGRALALGFMGTLARLPLGRYVIQAMGHMKPDERLALRRSSVTYATRVGLSPALDPAMRATAALAEFGFGFLEVGPIVGDDSAVAPRDQGPLRLRSEPDSIVMESPRVAMSAAGAAERLRRGGALGVPVLARIEPSSPEQARAMRAILDDHVDGYVVPAERLEHVQVTFIDGDEDDANNRRSAPMLWVVIDAAVWRDGDRRDRIKRATAESVIDGLVVTSDARPISDGETREFGTQERAAALETVEQARGEIGAGPIVVGAAGVHCPADALDYLEAGADMVQVDSGLVFAGPGLPKRINEAMLYRLLNASEAREPVARRAATESWFWSMLMGISMFVGGVIAMLVASTRVVLPYDERMSGLSRDQLAAVNDRLLSFMTHDRVTLAGTMLAVGLLYMILSWCGVRRGLHWAYVSVIASAMAGFFSFFSFLGFEYFDPFHAFVTAVLFQFLLLTMHAHLPARHGMEAPDLRNDWSWKCAQRGQLLFVIHGAILVVAGLVISTVGMTTVFVHEDLEFMDTTAEHLRSHPGLVPLVAHDRATFGGMLIACGVATLLPAMWGFRRGQAWLWWALLLAGNVAYVSTIAVHWVVGYDSLMHLLPAYGGLLLLWLGLLASRPFLVRRDGALEREWDRRLARHRNAAE